MWVSSANQQLPGLLVGGVHPGGYEDLYVSHIFTHPSSLSRSVTWVKLTKLKPTGGPTQISEEAVECDDLDKFLRRNEEWDEELFGPSKKLEAKPVGVPGAYSPLQMNPSHKPTITPNATPSKPKGGSHTKEIDVGEELGEYGLEGVTVDEQDLMALVSELIGEEGAGDLMRGFKAPANQKKTEKEGHDAVVQELAGKLKDAKLSEEKGKSRTASIKPEPDTKPTEGPPEVKQEDNLVTEATPSDADKATS